jgi:molybdopterin converting factor small subunit
MSLISIEIPTALRAFAGNKDTVQLEGQTVGELLEQLSRSFPQMK